MKQGFILLEVIIASAIAAMLSMMLLSSVTQLHRSASSVRSLMSVDVRFMLFFRQSVRDVSGALVPLVAKKTEQKEEAQKIELIPIEHVFTTGENTSARELSFITTNVLPSYSTGKPHLVRVTYRMEPDPEHQGSYRILRSESYDLVYQKSDTKKSETHTLIDGVKDLSLEFMALVEDKKEAGDQTSQQTTVATPKKKKIVVKQWPSEEIDKKILLPDYVMLSLTLWNDRYTRETKVAYTLPIIAVPKIPETPKTAEQAKPPLLTDKKNPGAPQTSIRQENKNKAPNTNKPTNSSTERPKLNVGPRPKSARSSHRELLAGVMR